MAVPYWNKKLWEPKFKKSSQNLRAHMPYFRRPSHIFMLFLACACVSYTKASKVVGFKVLVVATKNSSCSTTHICLTTLCSVKGITFTKLYDTLTAMVCVTQEVHLMYWYNNATVFLMKLYLTVLRFYDRLLFEFFSLTFLIANS